MRRKTIQWLIIVIGVSLMVNLSRDILRLVKVGEQVQQAERVLERRQRENEQLVVQKEDYTSDEFVEEMARNKLNMAKEEETVVILPENMAELLGRKKRQLAKSSPSWQQWWKLFF